MKILFRKATFNLITWGCGFFVVLTSLAMLVYAGGQAFDNSSAGYQFTRNFLSDLGRLTAYSGRPNTASAILFNTALGLAGVALVLFFLSFPRFFAHSRLFRLLSISGSLLGVLAGVCFAGISFTPADVARPAHIQFVMWAFRLFPLAVLVYIPALFLHPAYPRRYAWLFVLFWLLLAGYYLLLTNGPSIETSQGFVIQVIGQKVIAYASVVSVGLQAYGARKQA